MIPTTQVEDLSITHNQLGNIYQYAGDVDRALHHYQQCIRYNEACGDFFGAGETRANVAIALFRADRLASARAYAEAALANFMDFGGRAADRIRMIEQVVAAIDQAIAKKASGS